MQNNNNFHLNSDHCTKYSWSWPLTLYTSHRNTAQHKIYYSEKAVNKIAWN